LVLADRLTSPDRAAVGQFARDIGLAAIAEGSVTHEQRELMFGPIRLPPSAFVEP
jgi:hypothetical protein